MLWLNWKKRGFTPHVYQTERVLKHNTHKITTDFRLNLFDLTPLKISQTSPTTTLRDKTREAVRKPTRHLAAEIQTSTFSRSMHAAPPFADNAVA